MAAADDAAAHYTLHTDFVDKKQNLDVVVVLLLFELIELDLSIVVNDVTDETVAVAVDLAVGLAVEHVVVGEHWFGALEVVVTYNNRCNHCIVVVVVALVEPYYRQFVEAVFERVEAAVVAAAVMFAQQLAAEAVVVVVVEHLMVACLRRYYYCYC